MMPGLQASDRSLVLFTDLDGTLIDHHSYSAEGARKALELLAVRHIPVVFCSSKTFSEQRFIQQQLEIVQPFIFENGSALAVPPGYFSKPVLKRRDFETHASGYEIFQFAHAGFGEIRNVLAEFGDVQGFADVSDTELQAATGLSGAALLRARERWFTETLITPLDAEDALKLAGKLSLSGFTLSRGGRFHTIQSAQTDKGKAVQWLSGIFREILKPPLAFAAVGDSLNDMPMLASVDHAFLVRRPDGTWTDMDLPGLHSVEAIGPAGFSEVVKMLLNTLD